MHFEYHQKTPEMLTSLMNKSSVEAKTRMVCTPHLSLVARARSRTLHHLDSDPGNRNDNVHALLLRALPLVAECAVLLVVPVGANSAVHAAAAVLLWF
jgi:hypothetical protein